MNRYASMTNQEILQVRVNQLVAKWGEQERAAAEKQERLKSRGLLLNSIAHHDIDSIDEEARAEARRAMTPEDHVRLRQGG